MSARKLSKTTRAFFEEHRNGREVVFDTTADGYSARFEACCDLIEAEILDVHEPRHAGRFVWYRIVREPEALS